MAGSIGSLASAVLDSLAGKFSQNNRILRVSTSAGDQALLAESLRGEEEIDRGFRFQVAALSLDANIPLRSLVGQPILIELLTMASPEQLRPFHGHITAAEIAGANGGFARYQLTVEPWTSFLACGRDSRIFQGKTVFDILDTVFRAYEGKGRLAPAWRFDILDRSVYPQRSTTTQYQESDLAFAERLMNEEGLFYFFAHQGNPDSSSLGSHTLVIADHNGAFAANEQADVRYTRPGAVMREDSLDRWRTELRLQTNAIELASWDYRTCGLRGVSSAEQGAAVAVLASRDVPGAYAYSTRQQGQRIADNQLQAHQSRKEVHVGAGTVRTFAPGTTFTLHDHSIYNGGNSASFTILRVCHLAHNNLNADTNNALTGLLGQCKLKDANCVDLASSLHAVGRGVGERPVYRNRIDSIRTSVQYRPSITDGQGRPMHPRPEVRGQQTAIVVGPSGSVIHTDRDHRIKVQFHWQRGDASHSRLGHPFPNGHAGAPGDDRAGIWVRVATPLAPVAGANWGSHALPRVGQEVLVDFFEGNIDRPVVIGALYNGRGQGDAQHNQVAQGGGASTGNAPTWFPGEDGGHAHPAVLSGIKSQTLQTSQTGTGAFSQLVFDDSPGQARIGLQHHARPHQGTAELNLGHLRHQTDNQRLEPSGFGAELKTEHSAALRAGRGLLLTTDPASTSSDQLDCHSAASQIEQSAQLLSDLAGTAQKHNARMPEEGEPDSIPAVQAMRRTAALVQSTGNGRTGAGGQGNATAYSEAHVQLSSPSGVVATTPANVIFCARASSVLVAGQDINFASQGGWFHGTKAGISLFTYGKATNSNKPGKETGIRLHAASGRLSSQSQSGPTRITANKTVTFASVTGAVKVAGSKHVLMTAQGAYLKLEGGNIEIHGPGKMEFRASMKELAGPASATLHTPSLPKAAPIVTTDKPLFSQQFDLSHLASNDETAFSSARLPYSVYDKAGKFLASGTTGENGVTERIFTNEPTELVLLAGDGQWGVEEYFEDDEGNVSGPDDLESV
jgi:type VI secretion system secreted protein VgrG